MNYLDLIKKLKIDTDGHIQEGPFEGLPLKGILNLMRDSAWDYPSAIVAFFNKEEFPADDKGEIGVPMHPDETDLNAWNTHIEDEEKITMEDLEFDT